MLEDDEFNAQFDVYSFLFNNIDFQNENNSIDTNWNTISSNVHKNGWFYKIEC